MSSLQKSPDPKSNRFVEAGRKHQNGNLLVQCLKQIRENKKWWLLPLLLIMMGLALFIALSGTAAAPFIYTLF